MFLVPPPSKNRRDRSAEPNAHDPQAAMPHARSRRGGRDTFCKPAFPPCRLIWRCRRTCRRPRGREAALYAQGLPEGCARFYWLARVILGYHNPTWPTAKIIALIRWFTNRGDNGDEAFVKWHKWLIGTHRIGQYDHMPPDYRHRLPALEAQYCEWMAKLGG
jgi:hypothetical protein